MAALRSRGCPVPAVGVWGGPSGSPGEEVVCPRNDGHRQGSGVVGLSGKLGPRTRLKGGGQGLGWVFSAGFLWVVSRYGLRECFRHWQPDHPPTPRAGPRGVAS
jgi:hypothetical protein